MNVLVEDMKSLLNLFEEKVPDHDSNRLVLNSCNDRKTWIKAHGLHSEIRRRNLFAIEQGNKAKELQYCFEEVIASTLYNLTYPNDPFDSDSP
jgi:hypothetical protein